MGRRENFLPFGLLSPPREWLPCQWRAGAPGAFGRATREGLREPYSSRARLPSEAKPPDIPYARGETGSGSSSRGSSRMA